MKTNILFSLAACLLFGCAGKSSKNEASPETTLQTTLQIVFDNVVGNQDLVLGTTNYSNPLNQTFKVITFNYYVSNLKLQRADGSEYTVPQDSSYFLIREEVLASQTVTLRNLPAGEYVGVSFLLGVDSLRNTMDISRRTGVLDPATGAQGHYWTWNSGYIFMRLEGSSPESTGSANLIQYHVGGFGGYTSKLDNNIKKINLSFGTQKAQVRLDNKPQVKLKIDALKVISGSHLVDFANLPNVMSGANARNIAENTAQMFAFVSVTP